MLISPDFIWELHNSLLHLLLKNGGFLNTDISQGSVATRLGCGGVFIYHLATNFLLSLTVKKLWKSVNICKVMGKSSVSCFFLTHGVEWIFTARCYASAVLAVGLCLSVCVRLSVCLSVTSRSSTKTAKRRITQTTPHDSPGTLVFWCQRSPRNSTGVTSYEGAECRWGGSKSATYDK